MSNSNSSNTEKPGEGIRSLKSSTAFRVINFELYAKPVSIIVYYVRLCYISTALAHQAIHFPCKISIPTA